MKTDNPRLILSGKQETHVWAGSAQQVLPLFPHDYIQCVCTSPPYWGMRDYGGSYGGVYRPGIGVEETVERYVRKLGETLLQAYHILRDDGTLWLNIGDTYRDGQPLGIPWKVARSLQSYTWKLVSEIIWHKPNPMPSGGGRRCVPAHEFVFVFAKSFDYYFDPVAISEKAKYGSTDQHLSMPRSVWSIPVARYKGAHFATFPPELVRRMILAGTPEEGSCGKCYKPWKRVVKKTRAPTRPGRKSKVHKTDGQFKTVGHRDTARHTTATETLGFEPQCECGADPVPAIVLDPFCGSGTTLLVAKQLGRRGVGIDLNPEYVELAQKRIRSGK